jgi:hypothetical protein
MAAPVVLMRNYFVSLRTMEADVRNSTGEGKGLEPPTQQRKTADKGKERPPSIVLTTTVNLLKFQVEVKTFTTGSFELRNTRNGIRVVIKEIADYAAIMRHRDGRKIPYYTFHSKSLKTVKAVIRHLPEDTPAEDISSELTAPQWYSTFFPPVPLEALFHSTLYPQSCWCIIQVIHNCI